MGGEAFGEVGGREFNGPLGIPRAGRKAWGRSEHHGSDEAGLEGLEEHDGKGQEESRRKDDGNE